MNLQPISDFVSYCHTHIKGDEKGEAQTFLDLDCWQAIAPKGAKPGMSLRDLYRLQELPGKNPIKDLHHALDQAVAEAYGFPDKSFFKNQTGLYLDDPNPVLEFLLALNLQVAEKEALKEPVQVPGLPSFITDKSLYVTEDCVKWEG